MSARRIGLRRAVLVALMALLTGAGGGAKATGFGEFGVLNNQPARNAPVLEALRSALQFTFRCAARSVDDMLLVVAEALAAGQVDLGTAIDSLEAMSDCVQARPAAKFLRTVPANRADNAARYIRERAFRRNDVADYGKQGTLSKLAFEHRRKNGITDGRNVAVIEYSVNGKRMPPIVEHSIGKGAAGHAERRALAKVPAGEGVQVSRVYSERSPCADCWQELIGTDRRLGATVIEYTLPHQVDESHESWRKHLRTLFGKSR